MGRPHVEPDMWRDFATMFRCEISFFALFAFWGYTFQLHRYPQAAGCVLFLALLWRGSLFHWYLAGLVGLTALLVWQHAWLLVALPPLAALAGWGLRRLVVATRSLRPERSDEQRLASAGHLVAARVAAMMPLAGRLR